MQSVLSVSERRKLAAGRDKNSVNREEQLYFREVASHHRLGLIHDKLDEWLNLPLALIHVAPTAWSPAPTSP